MGTGGGFYIKLGIAIFLPIFKKIVRNHWADRNVIWHNQLESLGDSYKIMTLGLAYLLLSVYLLNLECMGMVLKYRIRNCSIFAYLFCLYYYHYLSYLYAFLLLFVPNLYF